MKTLAPNHRLNAGELAALFEAVAHLDPELVKAGEADGTDLRWLKTAMKKLHLQAKLLK